MVHYNVRLVYGYTGEYTGDSTDLLFLRARYYAPEIGRFITKDTWDGNENLPMSYNRWNYTSSNPINYTDPSGHCPIGMLQAPDGTCTFTFPEIVLIPFGITIDSWTITIPWCNNEITNSHQLTSTPTLTPYPYTPTPVPVIATPIPTQAQTKERYPVRVQLQERFVTYNGIPLPDYGNGVTVEQVVDALTILRGDPAIPKRHQKGADLAYLAAVSWTMSRPPYGVSGLLKKSFPFSTDPNWRFDIDILVGRHLKE